MAGRNTLINRFKWIYLTLALLFIVAIGKIIYIQVFDYEGWMKEAKRYQMNERPINPNRGNVYACDGKLVASTIPYYMVFMDMKAEPLHSKGGEYYKDNIDSLSLCLSKHFGEYSAAEYKRRMNVAYANGNRNYKVLSRKISYIEMQTLKTFPLFRDGRFRAGLDPNEMVNYRNGLKLRQLENRENLFGNLAGRTIGNVYGAGMGGQYGLELGYDSLLKGIPGVEQRTRVGNNWIYVTLQKPIDGYDVVTTLDMKMQDVADKALRDMLTQIDAAMGCVVLMEVATGEVKACVNLSRVSKGDYREQYNMAVADMSEPGSTFKTMSLMMALEDGVCKITDSVDTKNGQYTFYGSNIKDHNFNKGGYGKISVADVLAYSSNVGVMRIIDENYSKDPGKFVDAIYGTKITEPMDFGIRGAGKAEIRHPKTDPKRWYGTTLPWMAMGYEVKIPPIYTLTYYNAIANNGKMVKPRFVKEISEQGSTVKRFNTEVINSSIASQSTLKDIRSMLEGVVSYGTGKPVKSDVVTIAGKTGTAQIGYGGGDGRKTHQISFCGYFPAEKPLYSAIVVIRQPRVANPSAGGMSGVVFKKIAERIYSQVTQIEVDKMSRQEEEVLPRIASGSRQALRSALDFLDVDYRFDKAEWISTRQDERLLVGSAVALHDEFVPNVLHMGAQDAVYLIEKCGMHVQVYGKGKVVRQSVAGGSKVVKGSTVVLTLQ